jgi:hypothetical protein
MTAPKRFRWGYDRRSRVVLQVGRQRPRYVLFTWGGEGDPVMFGRVAKPAGWGPWRPMKEAPEFLRSAKARIE